jgi:hypothetical protein
MKYQLVLFLIFFSFQPMLSQKKIKLKKFKCCQKMPQNMDNILKSDTIFILYQKSDDKIFIQGQSENSEYHYKQYNFMNSIVFPVQLFDYENWKRVNIRESKIIYKKKSDICKNMYRTIDVKFLFKFEMHFGLTFFKETVFYIIELDSKINGKYKLIQVNNPEYVQY